MKSTTSRRSPPLQKAAGELIADGFAVCRIAPDEKRPTYPYWATRSAYADSFEPGDGIGIVCGPLSGSEDHALVCVDLDSPRAVRLADKYLPITDMVEGRPGKPNSHWWYLILLASISEEYWSHAPQSAPVMMRLYGHPGPRTISFRTEDSKEVIRFIGTGGQAVVPPSYHTSGEQREWQNGRRGEPSIVRLRTLLRAVEKLARKCGWKTKAEPCEVGSGNTTSEPDTNVDPFLTYRIHRYLDTLPPSISGHGGHNACFRAACALVWGFGLSEADAIKFIQRFNSRCLPKWSLRELTHKVREAAAATNNEKPRGHFL